MTEQEIVERERASRRLIDDMYAKSARTAALRPLKEADAEMFGDDRRQRRDTCDPFGPGQRRS